MILSLLKKQQISVELETKRLILRSPTISDQEQWLSLRTESRVFLEPWEPSWVQRPLMERDYLAFLKKRQKQWQTDRAYCFFIFQKENNNLIGNININNIARGVAQFGSLGYWIGEEYKNNGYMTEALKEVLNYAFNDLKLHKITASCLPNNKASISVLEKLNFTKEGYARKHLKIAGEWQDHLLYGILAEDSLLSSPNTQSYSCSD